MGMKDETRLSDSRQSPFTPPSPCLVWDIAISRRIVMALDRNIFMSLTLGQNLHSKSNKREDEFQVDPKDSYEGHEIFPDVMSR